MRLTSSRTLRLGVMALALGCGPRELALTLQLDGSCAFAVPQGGSVQYDVEAASTAAGPFASLCNGCLVTPQALAGGSTVAAFLRANAPTCAALHPGSFLRVRVVAWQTGNCTNSSVACGESAPLQVPDGSQDAQLPVLVSCSGANCNNQ